MALALVAFFLLVVFLSPWAIHYALKKWIESHGRLQAKIEDVDFNIFTGYLVIRSLVASGEGEGSFRWVRAQFDIAWKPLFKKRIRLDDISFTNGVMRIVQEKNGDLYAGGFRIDTAGKAPSPNQASGWEIGFGNIDLKNVRIDYKGPEIEREMIIRQAHVDPMQNWNPDSAGQFSISIAVADGSLDIQGSARPYAQKAEFKAKVNASKLPLGWLNPWLRTQQLGQITGLGAIDAVFQVSSAAQTHARMEGELSLTEVTGELQQVRVAHVAVGWDGAVQMTDIGNGKNGPQVKAHGTLALEKAQIDTAEPKVGAAADGISMNGDFSLSQGDQSALIFAGNAKAQAVRISEPGKNVQLADIGRIDIQNLQLTGSNRARADSVQVNQAKLLEHPAADKPAPVPALAWEEMDLEQIAVDLQQKQLKLTKIVFRNAEGNLLREANGSFSSAASLPLPAGKSASSAAPGPQWHYDIGHVSLDGKSNLRFTDNSVTPHVSLSLLNIKADIKQLRSAQAAPSPLNINMDFSKYASFSAQGTVSPFAEKISMDLRGKIKQFSLPDIRGYTERAIGYSIQSGKLYVDYHLLVREAVLDSVVKLFITNLDLKKIGAEDQTGLNQELGMPLNLALDLIRDKDGSIRLRLPVTGSFAAPQVDFNSVIVKAVRNATYKAIKTAALGYFAPLGAVYVAGKLFGRAVALRLNPIDFVPGQTDLTPQSTAYLDQVAAKLRNKPKVDILLCGQAAPADRDALSRMAGAKEANTTTAKEAKHPRGKNQKPAQAAPQVTKDMLLKLAKQRAEAARSYLASQGIDSGRLVICAPEISKEKGAKPQVELAL